jgi:Zn-dependent M28 family amino/carboxypeptidase
MRMRHYVLGCFLAVSLQASEFPPEVMEAADAIEPRRIEAHVHFLADDLLEGRGTATRGHEIAAKYVATRFRASGLEPGGDDGSWYQTVPLREAELLSGSLELFEEGAWRKLTAGEDFFLFADVERTRSSIEAPLTFVGYGVSAPELGWDDYDGIDVEGRVVVVLRNAPAAFPNNQRAYHASTSGKRATAAARGAVGMIELSTPQQDERSPWSRGVSAAKQTLRWLDGEGNPNDPLPGLLAHGRLSRSGAAILFDSSPESLDQMLQRVEAGEKLESFHLDRTVRIRTENRHGTLHSPNVVGILEGADPELRSEYVIVVAHLDHLGLSNDESDPQIYNGAHDNASGVATLLEMARTMGAMKQRPRRSIAFLAVTGEERGLLGSDYFANHPPARIETMAAAFSLDMFLMLYPLHDVVGFGAEHSSLGDDLAKAASELGIGLSPDLAPDEVLFIRTDHYPFVKRGVPALFVSHGHDSGDPGTDGAELVKEWMKSVYHTPRDDLSQNFDWEAGAAFARLNLLLGWVVADADEPPRWNRGDFFGETFGGR